jgi:hypothetical protein
VRSPGIPPRSGGTGVGDSAAGSPLRSAGTADDDSARGSPLSSDAHSAGEKKEHFIFSTLSIARAWSILFIGVPWQLICIHVPIWVSLNAGESIHSLCVVHNWLASNP